MKRAFKSSAVVSFLLAAAIFSSAIPAGAQMAPGKMESKTGVPGAGAQQMSEMQHNMAGQMSDMSTAMSKGTMTPAVQKQMSERMGTMATMMDGMSGMMGKGMMADADSQKRMDQMRVQMNSMMQGGQHMMK
jgi:hypothetical protein